MLNIHKGDRIKLSDEAHHELGMMVVDFIDGNTVCGDFVQAADFIRVNHLFKEYERLANKKKYKSMLQVEAKIAALHLHALPTDKDEMEAYDVEIWHANFASMRLGSLMTRHQ